MTIQSHADSDQNCDGMLGMDMDGDGAFEPGTCDEGDDCDDRQRA